MKYKIALTLQSILLVAALTACNTTLTNETTLPSTSDPSADFGSTSGSQFFSATDQSDYLWQLSILHAEVSDNLANTQTFILYGGDTEDIQYTKTPSPGYTFLLLELSIEKNGVGGQPFSWSDTYVEDSTGSRYRRMENDVFLEDHDLPRLKSTDLTIGGNSGYICLEIPADTDMSSLKLVHDTEEEFNILPISIE